jgi:tetratricopeptide (TPR) repeat protein
VKAVRLSGLLATLVLVLSTLRAQDAKIAADNLEYSREFYSGVHVSAIAESQPSFGYQRYPDNGPERIQCDQGTFARKHGKPWLRSEDWGESGRTVDPQVARKLDGWVKLVEAAFDFVPSQVKLAKKSREGVRVEWIFEARAANQKVPSVRLRFARPLYDKNPNVLLHGFEGSLPATGGKTRERVKFSFGYFIAASGFELSEAAWENLETPKELENKPVDLTKIDIGPKPDNAEGFLNRAGARGFNGDMNGAIADLSRAIDLDPKSEPAVYRRGAFKLQKGDYDGAIADLTRAIELSPNTADYYSDRGLAKLRKRDNDGAIVDFTRAIELDAKNAIAYRNRALAKNIKGDADGAIADYNRAIELDPTNAGAFNSRGMIKKSKGDLEGAITDFTSAIELNDKLAIAYKNRGEARRTKGDAAGATEDLKRAGELDPGLMSKDSAVDSKNNGSSAATTVSLLDGKLKIDLPPDFSRDPDDPKDPKTLAKFSGPDSAWGAVLRGTHGLTPEKLEGYLKMRVAEYSKGFKWLPKDSQLQWLKKEIVTIDGRKWADWRYVPMLKGKKDYSHNPVYTRFLTTSYKGQLLEITFTSNLNTAPELKEEIDHIMDAVHLEE